MATAFLPVHDSILPQENWQNGSFFPFGLKLSSGGHSFWIVDCKHIVLEFSLHVFNTLQPLATAYNALDASLETSSNSLTCLNSCTREQKVLTIMTKHLLRSISY